MTQVEQPSREQVEALHQKYIEALELLYMENREQYGDIKVDLIVE